MPQNPFEQTEANTTVGSRKEVPNGQAEPALPDNDKQVADKREYGEKLTKNSTCKEKKKEVIM